MLDYIISSGTGYDQKNVYVLVSDAGVDANDTNNTATSVEGIIGIGNAFVTSWSLEAAVGAIPTVSCALEGQNIVFTGGGGSYNIGNPAVVDGVDISTSNIVALEDPGLFDSSTEVSAVRPGDITLKLGTSDTDNAPMFGLTESDLKIQSATVAMTNWS